MKILWAEIFKLLKPTVFVPTIAETQMKLEFLKIFDELVPNTAFLTNLDRSGKPEFDRKMSYKIETAAGRNILFLSILCDEEDIYSKYFKLLPPVKAIE